jgi:hypothetical protein
MFIIAQGGKTYARLSFNVGPQTAQEMNVEIDYSQKFEASNAAEWQREFAASVRKVQRRNPFSPLSKRVGNNFLNETAEPDEPYSGEFDTAFDQCGDDEDWFEYLNSNSLFLDWEYEECEMPLSTVPA